MAKTFDMNQIRYSCGDIDSMAQAISKNPEAEEGYKRKYKYII
ncbi:MAG: hypothetical protein EZS28_033548, partial [Streblomastix strix]